MKRHIKKLVAIMAGGIAAVSLMASTYIQQNVECHAAETYDCTFLAHNGCTITTSQGTVSDCVGYDPGPSQNTATNGNQNCTWTESHSQTGISYNRPPAGSPQPVAVNTCSGECYPQ
ncbi:MAG TPA: hypothetical protein VGF13_08985 [Verrucomicrobiae bacterium]|jgi:hypothetical protein